jgi:hypothetical protein
MTVTYVGEKKGSFPPAAVVSISDEDLGIA